MILNKLNNLLVRRITNDFAFDYGQLQLSIHPSINDDDLINKIIDDIKLMPEIPTTIDKAEINFYKYNYKEENNSKSELLAFIFASINKDWNIIEGIDTTTEKKHYWLETNNIVFDPSSLLVTSKDTYYKGFRKLKELKNEDIIEYIKNNNNLYKFYHKSIFKNYSSKKDSSFSIDFINKIIEEFNKNVDKQYSLDNSSIQYLKDNIIFDDFIKLRQVLTKKRTYFLQSEKIAIHPDIDPGILDIIKKDTSNIDELMKKEYNIGVNYFRGTLGNCYGLSILYNLYNESFKLVQGGIPYKERLDGIFIEKFYQHSWLEKDNIVYDPALKIIVPKELYYIFVEKQDEYSKEQTENILKRIGFNLTHFRDYMNGEQVGNDETYKYRLFTKTMDSQEMEEQGKRLILTLKKDQK